MITVALTIWTILVALAGLVMAFARTGPSEAASNLSRWIEWCGGHRISAWLKAGSADRWLYRSGMVAMAVLLFVGGMGLQSWIIRGDPIPTPNSIAGTGSQRRLSDDQKSRLAHELAKLTPLPSQIAIAFTNGDQETEIYQHDFGDAFRRAGIQPLYDWTDSPDGPYQVGVYIAAKEPSSPLAPKLHDALKTIGLSVDIIPFPKAGISGAQDSGSVVLYVAPRPL